MAGKAPHDATGPPPVPGDVGASRTTKRGDLADLRLLKMAIDQCWPVPDAVKRKAVGRMKEILTQGKNRPRAWTAAARALVSMTTATTSTVGVALQAKAMEEVERRLDELERKAPGDQT